MEQVLRFPIVTQEIYSRYLQLKNRIDSIENLMLGLLRDCQAGNNEVNKCAQLILFDLKYILSHPAISKGKNASTFMEDRAVILMRAQRTDDLPRANPPIETIVDADLLEHIPEEKRRIIASNFREKGDLIYFNSAENRQVKISIKGLMPNNNEINFGAIEYTSVFSGIDLEERGRTRTVIHEGREFNIGLGSRPILQSTFNYIQTTGMWEQFLSRFEACFKAVFQEDVFIFIKDFYRLKVYIIKNADFVESVVNSVIQSREDPNRCLINRWEGNSIRIHRDMLLQNARTTHIDQPYLNLIDEPRIIGMLNQVNAAKTGMLFQYIQE